MALGNLADGQLKVADDEIKGRKWDSAYVKHIACYAITEELPEWASADTPRAHCVYVDMIYTDDIRKPVFVLKTKKGLEHAYTIAAKCAKELGV